jgi:hypothetical protein
MLKVRKDLKTEVESFCRLDGDEVGRFVISAWHVELMDLELGISFASRRGSECGQSPPVP